MGNVICFFKVKIVKLDFSFFEVEVKVSLIVDIDMFMLEKIVFVDKEIVKYVVIKIRDGDVVFIYGYFFVVEMILVRVKEMGKKF